MKKKCSYFIGFVLLVGGIFSGFKRYEITLLQDLRIEPTQPLFYDVQTEEAFEYCTSVKEEKLDIPFTGKTFTGFKQALAVRESLGIYTLVNPFGYMGKYQFGKSALRSVGINDASGFLTNPIMQEKAFEALLAKNKWELRKEIKQYSGKRIGGVTITESGLLAAAHLGGAFSVKKFLKSNGSAGFRDGFGTSIRTYLKKFAGYDTSHIIADSNPVVVV
ncbi:peptidoglycan-binding protein LysM [Myroides guanonis]|nr:peptidoglycan-binding protein LysM [Myroides guanonis]